MKRPPPDTRVTCARLISSVVHGGRSLAALGPAALAEFDDERDRAFVQACVYGVLRELFGLRARLRTLLARPLRGKDADIEALLLAGLYQLGGMHMPAHAAVSSSVEAARRLGKPWACALVNGVLRQAEREPPASSANGDECVRFEHPAWMIERIRHDWPQDWSEILRQGNAQAPLTLRVNRLRRNVDDYLALLESRGLTAVATRHADHGIRLAAPVPVASLPEFDLGSVSVQDEAAQLAPALLGPRAGDRVLDACAAPGGKTTHLLEFAPGIDLLALDLSAARLASVADNLRRLGLDCALRTADAGTPSAWWDGRPFDRILLDAPCSALGIVRRHPDIRVHRTADDIERLSAEQRRLLFALWPLLRPGGRLLYATCSIMPAENDAVVAALLAAHDEVRVEPLAAAWGRSTRYGRQLLPGDDGMDGFYFAALTRTPGAG